MSEDPHPLTCLCSPTLHTQGQTGTRAAFPWQPPCHSPREPIGAGLSGRRWPGRTHRAALRSCTGRVCSGPRLRDGAVCRTGEHGPRRAQGANLRASGGLLSETFLQPLVRRRPPEAAGPAQEPPLHTQEKQAEQKPGKASRTSHPGAQHGRCLSPPGTGWSATQLTKDVCASQPGRGLPFLRVFS